MVFVVLFVLLCSLNLVKSDNLVNFDYLLLSQQWPQTLCLDDPGRKCVVPANVTTWTVHGLWPSDNKDPDKPDNCCTDPSCEFVAQNISSIIGALNKYWPNLFQDSPKTEFWQHEWMKHGSCAGSVQLLSNELMFFNTTLALRDKYSVTKFFVSASILPRADGYEYEEVYNAIDQGVGGKAFEMMCSYDKKTRTQYIAEVHICFDKNLQLLDCPMQHRQHSLYKRSNNAVFTMTQTDRTRRVYYTSKCRKNESIVYPVTQHK